MTSFLTRGIHSPVATQAPISGKAFLDIYDIEQRKLGSKDMEYQASRYHGAKDVNFQIYPHQVVVGRKGSCHVGNYAGPKSEYGLTTAAGLNVSRTPEHTMRDMYFMGVATSEVPYGGDTMYSSDPIGEAFSFLRSGTVTVRWYDREDGKPGDLVCWTMPQLKDHGHPGKPKDKEEFSYDNGFNPLSRHMYGEAAFDNPVYYIKKCDPTDYGYQLAASFWAFSKTKSEGGVSDLGLKDLLDPDNDLTSIQEEALSWFFGIQGLFAAAVGVSSEESRNEFKQTVGELLNTKKLKELMDRVFGMYTFHGDNPDFKPQPDDDKEPLHYGMNHCMKLLTGAVTSATYAKSERAVGRLLNGVKQGDDADIMMQHVKIGF